MQRRPQVPTRKPGSGGWPLTTGSGSPARAAGRTPAPWSSAFRFESDQGPLWLKVNGTGTRHEGALVSLLGHLEPALVPEVLGVAEDRGWFLTRDAGPTMRAVARPQASWSPWETLLARYAEAQVRLAAHQEAVLATGTPDLRPDSLPGHAATLVDQLSSMGPEAGGLTGDEGERLRRRLPEYTAWCAELAGSGIPATVQHDDLHSGNVGWPGRDGATARIVDWGDASLGHPLATMLATLNSIAHHARVEVDDPRVERVRDAYLEPFTTVADRRQLVAAVALARRVGCVSRALSYQRALAGVPLRTERELDFPVRGWLLELLED